MSLSKKECDILGTAYQNWFDGVIETVNWNGDDDIDHQLKCIRIASIWVHYPEINYLTKKPNEEEFGLLLKMASDIDTLGSIVYSNWDHPERELLNLMMVNADLNRKISFSDFAKFIKNQNFPERKNFSVFQAGKMLLGCRLLRFERAIREINDDEEFVFEENEWLSPQKYFYFSPLRVRRIIL